jgi:hypothetical protein
MLILSIGVSHSLGDCVVLNFPGNYAQVEDVVLSKGDFSADRLLREVVF